MDESQRELREIKPLNHTVNYNLGRFRIADFTVDAQQCRSNLVIQVSITVFNSIQACDE